MITSKTFLKILRVTSPILSKLHPEIRLLLARSIKSPGFHTLLDPNAMKDYSKLNQKEYFKEIRFLNNTIMKVDLNDHIGFRSALYGYWDLTSFEIAKKMGFDNLIYIDIGANVGTTAIPIGKNNVKVIAFEANPLMASHLLENLARNQIQRMVVFPMALGDTNMEYSYQNLHTPVGNRGSGSILKNWNANKPENEISSCYFSTLDTSLKYLGYELSDAKPVKLLIKIDVEGFESEVLRGAKETIQTLRPVLIIENNPSEGLEVFYGWLKAINYHFAYFDGQINFDLIDFKKRYENLVAIPRESSLLIT